MFRKDSPKMLRVERDQMISALAPDRPDQAFSTARGRMRFTIKEKGGVKAGVFIEFLKRLMVGATRPIVLIVESRPGASREGDQGVIETLGGKLRLFFLPPYWPDRNPDELVWKHLKADTAGRRAAASTLDPPY
ncbi:MAG: transposase [Gammaproteobacteria bacterium]